MVYSERLAGYHGGQHMPLRVSAPYANENLVVNKPVCWRFLPRILGLAICGTFFSGGGVAIRVNLCWGIDVGERTGSCFDY